MPTGVPRDLDYHDHRVAVAASARGTVRPPCASSLADKGFQRALGSVVVR